MPIDAERPHDPDQDADPRELWRWVGAAVRPWLGWILIAAGALLMLVGWFGVSREAQPGKQIPYLVSGGIGGMFLAVLGAYFLGTQELRRDSGRLDRLEAMVEELHGALLRRPDAPDPIADGAVASDGPSRRVVAMEGGDLFHRATCRLVQGKDGTQITPAAAKKAGLAPCPACTPTAAKAS